MIRRALWLVAVLTAGCTEIDTPAEIRVGLILSENSALGTAAWRPMRRGADLAVAAVDRDGGLLVAGRRHPVKLEVADDRGRPDEAVSAARRLINQREVVALVGPILSSGALAVARAAEVLRVPMISPTATHPGVTADRSYVFRVCFDDDRQGRVLAAFARRELGAETAAVLFDVTSDYNRHLAESFRGAFEAAGGRVVLEPYTLGREDFLAPLGRLAAMAPDVLFLPNYVDDVPRQARQARGLGLRATLLGGDTWDGDGYAGEAAFEGSFFASAWHVDMGTGEPARSFIRDYRAAHGEDPESGAALTYDALGLLFHAIASEGSLDGEAIRRGLAGLAGYRGVTGELSYRGRGDPARGVAILEITDGRIAMREWIAP